MKNPDYDEQNNYMSKAMGEIDPFMPAMEIIPLEDGMITMAIPSAETDNVSDQMVHELRNIQINTISHEEPISPHPQPQTSFLPTTKPKATPAKIIPREPSTPFVTLKLSGIQTALVAFTCLALSIGGTYSMSQYQTVQNTANEYQNSLQKVQLENEALTQNALTSQNLEESNVYALQAKTIEIQSKLNELEALKDNLDQQLMVVNSYDSLSDLVTPMSNMNLESDATYTPIVQTAYYQDAALSAQLSRLSANLDATGLGFTDIATNTIESLSDVTSVPNGSPVAESVLTSGYSPNGESGRIHKAIDLATYGNHVPIYSTASGTIITSSYNSGYGNYVEIDHGNGFTTLYAHNEENYVAVGDFVQKGQLLALTGSTGNSTGIHCHYEVKLHGVAQNPMDYL